MKGKFSALFLLTVLVGLALVSASGSFTVSTNTLTFSSQSVNSTTFSITPASPLNLSSLSLTSPLTIKYEDGTPVPFSFSPSFPITGISTTSPIQVTLSTTADFTRFLLGKTYSGSFVVQDTAAPANIETINVNMQRAYCKYGNVPVVGSNLTMDSVEDKTSGRDDFNWAPLDNVKLDVDVANDADTSQKVTVKLELYSVAGNKFIELSGDKEIDDTIRISDGEDETFSFEFQLPGDITEGTYQLFVKAYVDGKESTQCIDGSTTSVTIEFQDDIGIDQLDFPGTLQCGDTGTVSLDIYNFNLGDNEQLRARLVNKELGINLVSDDFELDEGDSERVSLDFNIPLNVTEKIYRFDLLIDYDYRENSDIYLSTNSDNSLSIKVEGGCITAATTENTQITATLESDAVAGQNIIVRANINNLGTSSQTYTVLVSGYDNFATLESINPQTFTLASGQSKDVLITLKANEDASGDYTFDIKAISGGQIKQQQLSLTIEGKTSAFTGLNSLITNFSGNWLIWVIVIVNIVLIVLIVIIAVRIARK